MESNWGYYAKLKRSSKEFQEFARTLNMSEMTQFNRFAKDIKLNEFGVSLGELRKQMNIENYDHTYETFVDYLHILDEHSKKGFLNHFSSTGYDHKPMLRKVYENLRTAARNGFYVDFCKHRMGVLVSISKEGEKMHQEKKVKEIVEKREEENNQGVIFSPTVGYWKEIGLNGEQGKQILDYLFQFKKNESFSCSEGQFSLTFSKEKETGKRLDTGEKVNRIIFKVDIKTKKVHVKNCTLLVNPEFSKRVEGKVNKYGGVRDAKTGRMVSGYNGHFNLIFDFPKKIDQDGIYVYTQKTISNQKVIQETFQTLMKGIAFHIQS